VARGVRRITAVTGPKALQRCRDTDDLVARLQRQLKAPQAAELPTRIEALQNEVRGLTKQLADLTSASVAGALEGLLASSETVSGVRIVARALQNVTREALRDYADQLREKHSPIAVVLGAEIEGKLALIAAVSKPLVKDRGLHAGNAVKAAAAAAGGGGGGRPDMAEAGAREVDKLEAAVAAGAAVLKAQLGT